MRDITDQLLLSLVLLLIAWDLILTIIFTYFFIKNKIIILSKTSRIKKKKIKRVKRYVVFLVEAESTITGEKVEEIVRKNLLKLFGETGLNNSSLKLVYYDPISMAGIFSCDREWTPMVILAMQTVNKPMKVIPRRKTGSYKKAMRYI